MDARVRIRHIRSNGFTLSEMLVALVVGLLVLIGIHQIFVSSLTAQTTTSSQMEVDRRAQVAMDEITSMLRQASPSIKELTSAILVDYDAAHPDRIDFAGPPGTDLEPPKDDDKGDIIHYRYWLDSDALKRSIGGSGYTGVLATGVTKLEFTFYNVAGSVISDKTKTVRVGITLAIQDGRNWSVVRSAVRLRNM